MKRIMKAAWIFAASALVFSSCMEEQILAPQDEQAEKVTVNITAGTLQTKTFLDGSTQVKWKGDETIEVLEQAGTSFHHVTSDPAVTPDGLTAKFKATLNAATATSFNYAAVYPSTSFVTNDNSAFDRMKLELPAEQHPTETSFDPAADLLVAKNVQLTAQPTDLNFQFARPVAVMEMTVKGLADGENIQSVQFSSTSAVLAGRMYYDFTTDKVIEYGYQGQDAHVINCLYDAPYAAVRAGNKIYFTVYPTADKQALADFSVTVNTDKATYTKDVKPANPLTIKANDLVRFGVANLTREARVYDEYKLLTDAQKYTLQVGDKVIIASGNDGAVKLMSAQNGSKRGSVEGATVSNGVISSLPAEARVITIENGFTPGSFALVDNLQTDGKYIYAPADKTDLKSQSNLNNNASWTVDYDANGIAHFKNVAYLASERRIGFNGTSVGFYAPSGFPAYIFYKKGQPKTPLATPTELYAEQEDPNINAVTVIWSAVPDAASYTVTCGDKVQTVTTTSATITELAWETTHTISVVANPADGSETLKSSAPATCDVAVGADPTPAEHLADGAYAVIAEHSGRFYALTPVYFDHTLQATEITFAKGDASVKAAKNQIWNLAYQSGNDTYHIAQGTEYLNFAISGNAGQYKNAKVTATAQDMSLVKNADGTYALKATTNGTTCNMGLYSATDGMGYSFDDQKTGFNPTLYVIPAIVDTTPIYSLADATVEIPSAAATGHALTSVTANEYVQETGFQVSSDQTWLKNLHVSGGQLLADVEANADATARTATVTVTYTGAKVETQTITVKQLEAGAVAEKTETLMFGGHADFSTWSSGYANHTLVYPDVEVSFESANKQSGTITDQPVTKGGAVTLSMKNGLKLKKVSFQFKQWSSKKPQTATLKYSTDGTTFHPMNPEVASATFAIPETVLPENTVAVQVTFSSSKNQIGITSATVTY